MTADASGHAPDLSGYCDTCHCPSSDVHWRVAHGVFVAGTGVLFFTRLAVRLVRSRHRKRPRARFKNGQGIRFARWLGMSTNRTTPPNRSVDGEPSPDGPNLDRLPDAPLPDASHATHVPRFPAEPEDHPVLDPTNPASKPQGTTKDQVDTMEGEGQAQQPGQAPPTNTDATGF